ncbi:MAG TPA: histidinol-phosphate transaminase [Terriglobales bacterium]|nr:histidinol-phosphate transaminase [Terriglobales bacterium]
MPVSRRHFLTAFTAGTAVAAAGRVIPFEAGWARDFELKTAAAFALPQTATAPARHSSRAAHARGGRGAIILSSNENPYGAPPKVAAVMQQCLAVTNRYPFVQQHELVAALARTLRRSEQELLVGCGSTEVLRMAAAAYTGPGKRLIVPHPTFESIEWYATNCGAETVRVPLTSTWAHDLDAMLAATRGHSGLIYICNPNNPTATLTPRKQLAEFLTRVPAEFTVLLDEAYHHFAVGEPEYQSFLADGGGNPRVVVARTFSKVYGMAGLRLGYAAGSREAIAPMAKCQLQDNVNMLAAQCGAAALEDDAGMLAASKRIVGDREAFLAASRARKLHVMPSSANFAMVETGRPVRDVIAGFRERGISIGRPFPTLEKWARVSFGTPEEMKAFWDAWDEMKIG